MPSLKVFGISLHEIHLSLFPLTLLNDLGRKGSRKLQGYGRQWGESQVSRFLHLSFRWNPSELVGWRNQWNTDVLGRFFAWSPKMYLWIRGELHWFSVSLQLWRRPEWMVIFLCFPYVKWSLFFEMVHSKYVILNKLVQWWN